MKPWFRVSPLKRQIAVVSAFVSITFNGAAPRPAWSNSKNSSSGSSRDTTHDWVTTVGIIKKSIAPVVCLAKQRDGSFTVKLVDGSAFFVSKTGVFITASHVILDFTKGAISCDTTAIYLPTGEWPNDGVIKANLHWFQFIPSGCYVELSVDLGLCKTTVDPSLTQGIAISAVDFGPDTVPDGTDVAFTGFPLRTPIPRTARGSVSGYGSLNGETFELVIDKNTWPGASGSPVYLVDGRVVGIILARGTEEATGLAFARSGNVIRRFLATSKEKGGPNRE